MVEPMKHRLCLGPCGLTLAAYMFERRRVCRACASRQGNAARRRWSLRHPDRHREIARESAARARKAKAPAYEREKARKRRMYRLDPEWRESQLRRFAAYRNRKVEPKP